MTHDDPLWNPDAEPDAGYRAERDAVDARRFTHADVDDGMGSLAWHYAEYHAGVVRPDREVVGVARTPEDLEPLVLEWQHVLGGRSA